eukprot:NODE_19762_length_828_cov_11.776034.p2 GENE.NODE_19762_length_828_cov_11.776034~~NODE_19762_length_828_cov_11.776034.p2  ORF type:complete len:175 (-),score=11.86 NODE_19762_length_828_cov_11.776034:178-702(-)
MEGGQKMPPHTMWGKWEKIDDSSSSSAECDSIGIANIANDRVLSSATAMTSHEEGTCAPCWFHTKESGCWHGAQCRYCHEPHDTTQVKDRVRWPRPNKHVRARCKAVVEAVASSGMTLHDGESPPIDPSVRTAYFTRLMRARQKTDAVVDAVASTARTVRDGESSPMSSAMRYE